MARMHSPPHPGEVLREFLPARMTIEDVARRLMDDTTTRRSASQA